MKILLQNKIRTQVHYAPIYKHLIFFDIKKKYLDGCNKYYEKCLSIPIFYDLKINQANKVFKTISKIINEQTKLFNINTSKRN